MDSEYYQKYLDFKHKGLKKLANKELNLLIASFNGYQEKVAWTKNFLESGKYGHRIQYKLYREIIFPVLLNGFQQQDLWCTEWLIKTIANLYAAKELHKQIRYKTKFDLLVEYYSIDPENQDIREQILKILFKWFEFADHEWGEGYGGILWGNDSYTIHTYRDIVNYIEFTEELLKRSNKRLIEFRSHVDEYFTRVEILK